jgi:hypothetical protein
MNEPGSGFAALEHWTQGAGRRALTHGSSFRRWFQLVLAPRHSKKRCTLPNRVTPLFSFFFFFKLPPSLSRFLPSHFSHVVNRTCNLTLPTFYISFSPTITQSFFSLSHSGISHLPLLRPLASASASSAVRRLYPFSIPIRFWSSPIETVSETPLPQLARRTHTHTNWSRPTAC